MRLKELRHNLWNLGFIEEGLEYSLSAKKLKIHWVKKRFKDRWFADPFILDVSDNEIIILAEEYCYDVKKGRIARVVIDRHTYEEKEFEIILDLPTHLSFPYIIRLNDKVYIMPENSASGNLSLYEYDDVNRKVSFSHYITNEPLVDAILFNMEDKTYLLATIYPDVNSNSVKVYSFDKTKMVVMERIATVEFPKLYGRNAGEVFVVNDQLYRPAQDCTLRYGHGVIIQRIEQNNGNFSLENVNSFYPETFKYNQGIHTFNNYKGMVVIDARGFRNPFIGRILTILFKFFRKK